MDPHSNQTLGYHLFLEPSGALKDELHASIDMLAREYDGPVFNPHVTLLGRIRENSDEEVLAKARTLAASLTPFTLTLGTVGYEDVYFRALYIRIKELEPVTAYHRAARTAFGMEHEDPYLPHLSLLYGEYPEAQKVRTIESLTYPVEREFAVDRIHVYRTPGETHRWHKIGEAEFGS